MFYFEVCRQPCLPVKLPACVIVFPCPDVVHLCLVVSFSLMCKSCVSLAFYARSCGCYVSGEGFPSDFLASEPV